jgi:hypothetical protein
MPFTTSNAGFRRTRSPIRRKVAGPCHLARLLMPTRWARWMVFLLAVMAAALVGLALGTASTARASNCAGDSWKGGSGSWWDKSMWSGGVPTQDDVVCIDAKEPSKVFAMVTHVAAGSTPNQPTAKALTIGSGGAPQQLFISPGKYEGTPSYHVITNFTSAGLVTIGANGEIDASSDTDAYTELSAGGGWLNDGTFVTSGGNAANPVTVGSGAADFVNHKNVVLSAAQTIFGGAALSTTGNVTVVGALVLQGTAVSATGAGFIVSGRVTNGGSITVQGGTVTQLGGVTSLETPSL